MPGNWSGWKIGQVTEIGWKWWLAAADKYEWPTRDIYIYMYTNPGRYINYVACSIKIDLRLIGNARAHATREKPCSVSTDFQPPPRYYRGQFRNEHLANERAPWTTRIEADNRPMNANETCSNNKLSSPTILRLFSAIRSLLSYQILLIRGLEEGRRKVE